MCTTAPETTSSKRNSVQFELERLSCKPTTVKMSGRDGPPRDNYTMSIPIMNKVSSRPTASIEQLNYQMIRAITNINKKEVNTEYVDLVIKLKLELATARSDMDTISHSHRLLSGENSSLRSSLFSVTQDREHIETKMEMVSAANSNLKEKVRTLKTERAELRVQVEVLQFECNKLKKYKGYKRLYEELRIDHKQYEGERDGHSRNQISDKRSCSDRQAQPWLKNLSRLRRLSFNESLCDKRKESDNCLKNEHCRDHTAYAGSTCNSSGSKKMEHSKDHTVYAGLTRNSSGKKNMKSPMVRHLLVEWGDDISKMQRKDSI